MSATRRPRSNDGHPTISAPGPTPCRLGLDVAFDASTSAPRTAADFGRVVEVLGEELHRFVLVPSRIRLLPPTRIERRRILIRSSVPRARISWPWPAPSMGLPTTPDAGPPASLAELPYIPAGGHRRPTSAHLTLQRT
jgi:hypothetical protein